MIIRATDTEIELAGAAAELQAISQTLAALETGQRCRFVADAGADPSPYRHTLTAFDATATSGPIRVGINNDVLEAAGSPEMFDIFASFFDLSDDLGSGYHVHHEWYPGNDYIAEDSRPLVILLVR